MQTYQYDPEVLAKACAALAISAQRDGKTHAEAALREMEGLGTVASYLLDDETNVQTVCAAIVKLAVYAIIKHAWSDCKEGWQLAEPHFDGKANSTTLTSYMALAHSCTVIPSTTNAPLERQLSLLQGLLDWLVPGANLVELLHLIARTQDFMPKTH